MTTNSAQYSTDQIRNMITAIRGEDKNARLHALSNLQIIAKVLGPARTRSELLPYVIDTVDHTDEMWSIIASNLGQMLKYVGGYQEIMSLFNPLKFLCEMEASEVSDVAIESIINLARQIPSAAISQYVIPLIKTMCEDGWYPLRCAGASVLCSLYSTFTDEERTSLISLFNSLNVDSIVMVRRALVKGLVHIPKCPTIDEEVFPRIILTLASDESVAVTTELPAALAAFSSRFPDTVETVAKTILDAPNWQPEAVLITKLDKVFGDKPPKEVLEKVVSCAFNVSSVEVLAAVASQLPYLYEHGAFESDTNQFNLLIRNLKKEPSVSVRTALATSLGPIGKNNEVKPLIEEYLLGLLNSKEGEVKVAALQSIAVAGVGIIQAADNLKDILSYSTWRVKKLVAEKIAMIASTITRADFNNLQQILLSLLSDEASDVRIAAIEASVAVTKIYGKEWFDEVIAPFIIEKSSSPEYLARQTALRTIFEHEATEQFQEVLEKALNDPVPNIRLLLARELPTSKNSMLKALAADKDVDVAYFAKQRL